MDSLISLSIAKNYGCFPSRIAICGDVRVLSGFQKPMVATKKTRTTIVNVASNMVDERRLVAWTSVRQERWEGELVVEGEIPKWLCNVLTNIHKYRMERI
ncbi:hypothetical protein R6Q59_030966 [Mikania micrantha]